MFRKMILHGMCFFSIFSYAGVSSISLNDLQQLPFNDLVQDKNMKPQFNSGGVKAQVFIFMSARCPCSDSHVEHIKQLVANFKDFDFYIVHSNQDEPLVETKKYFTKQKFEIPVIQDSQAKIADLLHAYKTPHSFIIDREGNVLYQGGVTSSNHAPSAEKFFLKEALTDLHQGKSVRTKEGRTLGCMISRE